MKNPFAIFDLAYLAANVLVYSVAGGAAIAFGGWWWGESSISKAFALVLGYILFLHLFIFCVALLRRLVQKPLREGTFPIGMNEDYIAWGINSVCHGIVTASPFAGHISLVFYLNRLYLTLMGMHLPASALIGTHTIIRQPELIDIGERTVIGIGCVLSGHYSPNQTEHCHGRIHIGANTLVGMRTVIGGPVSIGDRTLIGADTNIFPNAHIGSDAKIGPFCRIQVGSRIPDRAIIKADSFISASMSIKEGETWAGNPAVCIHSPTNTPEENIDHGNA